MRVSTGTRHHVVFLDSCYAPYPALNFDHTVEYHACTRPDQLASRMQDATIVVTSDTRVTREGISAARHLQLLSTNATGTDHIDKVALHERGIPLCHVPAQTTQAVAEHAIALYYGLRNHLLEGHGVTLKGDGWAAHDNTQGRIRAHQRRLPRTNAEETMVVMGYGAVGKKMEQLGRALGMQVIIAERKHASAIRPGRVPFTDSLERGTLFMLAAPLNATSQGMIGGPELAIMDPEALVVNVGRGGLIDDAALVDALQQGYISGAAVDVYKQEPPTTANSAFIDPSIPGLLLSPHVAWCSRQAINQTRLTQKANLEGFVAGHPVNVVPCKPSNEK